MNEWITILVSISGILGGLYPILKDLWKKFYQIAKDKREENQDNEESK